MKIAICFSGHLRNIPEHIKNLKTNLLDVISEKHQYDIYMHTWDDNKTCNQMILNNDHYFPNKTYTITDIITLFKTNNIDIKDIIVENQNDISKLLNTENWLDNAQESSSIHDKLDTKYVRGVLTMLFWQYYGHHAVFNIIKNIDEYDYIIKTRPDMLYEPFNMQCLDMPVCFPLSHQKNNTSINSAFFGGQREYMKEILNYFNTIIYKNSTADMSLIRQYHKTDINLNNIFRYYIMKYLKFKPTFCSYDPKLYRTAKVIIKIL
jgi:hypothetical protein